MVVWQGTTEGGTTVPVQVDSDGKVVAIGQQGGVGPEGPKGDKGDKGDPGEYGPGDDVEFGSISARTVEVGEYALGVQGVKLHNGYVEATNTTTDYKVFVGELNGVEKSTITAGGAITAKGDVEATNDTGYTRLSALGQLSVMCDTAIPVDIRYSGDVRKSITTIGATGDITTDGSISAADSKAGITAEGELFFTSRGKRYKLFVAQGLVQAEEYTRATELQEKAEQLRQPKTQDIVPED